MKQRLFSEDEQWYCEHKAMPETHYALRFAAKEAVLKALGTGFTGMNFLDVEVARDDKGKPYPKLHGAAYDYAEKMGIIEMHLSLSYTKDTAVASAVALTAQARPAAKEKPSTREELAREFKELRSMLDNLDQEQLALQEEPDSQEDSQQDLLPMTVQEAELLTQQQEESDDSA